MAVIVKNPVAFRCKTFAERYKDHEASALLEEAAAIIQELDDDLSEAQLALTKAEESTSGDHSERPGYEALWADFGLSHASFLVMPRALLHEMPDGWQATMATLLSKWHSTWEWRGDIGEAVVQHRINGKLAKWPEYILNYRHPDRVAIDSMRSREAS